jgi:hypothetical protein
MVTDINSLTRPNLELPLARHHLSVGSRDVNASIQTASVVSLHHFSSIAAVSANRAVVRSLGSGEARRGKAKRMLYEVVLLHKQRILLLNAEPKLSVLCLIKNSD